MYFEYMSHQKYKMLEEKHKLVLGGPEGKRTSPIKSGGARRKTQSKR